MSGRQKRTYVALDVASGEEPHRDQMPRGQIEKPDEEPRIFDHPTGRWKRTGYCSRCGECCMGEDPSAADRRFTKKDKQGRQFESVCPLLRFDGEKFGCAGYGKHRYQLEASMDHPQCPDDMALTPSCTYRFERVE